MKVPLEIRYHGVEKTEVIEEEIREGAAKLEKVCDYLNSCRVALERESPKQPYHVTIDLTVPPGKELAVSRNSGKIDSHEVQTVIQHAFRAARKQLQQLVEKQRGEVKPHFDPETSGFVERLMPEEGYGFIRSVAGDEHYFHRNSVLDHEWDRLAIGTGVRFTPHAGEKGPQASSVRIVDKPGERAGSSGEEAVPRSGRGTTQRGGR